jgi:hypothetical protein
VVGTLERVLRWVDSAVHVLNAQHRVDANLWWYVEADGMLVGEDL